MNNRFKFRVWNKSLEKYVNNINISPFGLLGFIGSVFCFIDNNYVVEQCTGLKDKNGNLIYEGDILQNPNKDQYIVEWSVDGYWHIRQIDDEKFGCALASIKTLYDGWEIIGNIHEQAK